MSGANDENLSPLHLAARNGHDSTVELLLESGADINALGNDSSTPLYWAAFRGHISTVKLLIDKGANIDHCTYQGTSPLLIATFRGYLSIAEILIKNGALTKTGHDWSLLHYAARNGHEKIVQVLLENNEEINFSSLHRDTALHLAAQHGHISTVRVLLQKGAKAGALNAYNATPMILAAYEGHALIVKLLLEHIECSEGSIQIQPLCQKIFPLWIQVFAVFMKNDNGILNNLKPKEWTDNKGRGLAQLLTIHGELEVLQLLKPSFFEQKDALGRTALHEAAIRRERHDIYLWLLQEYSQLKSQKDIFGWTAAKLALQMGVKINK